MLWFACVESPLDGMELRSPEAAGLGVDTDLCYAPLWGSQPVFAAPFF